MVEWLGAYFYRSWQVGAIVGKQKVVEVYQPNEDGYDVLPGFSLAIAEIFKV